MGRRGWFEYIESASNWADGASRVLEDDEWASNNGFEFRQGAVPGWPWLTWGQQRIQQVFAATGATVGLAALGDVVQ